MAKLPRRGPLEQIVDRMTGAKLCFGEPVQVGATAVVPVSRVRLSGGLGYGSGPAEGGDGTGAGGGGGGHLEAHPLGYIELRSDGSTYHAIEDPERVQRMLRAGAAAAATLVTAFAGARRLRGARAPRLLGR